MGTFQNGDIDIKFPKNYTNIDCIVIEVTTDQSNWVIIREITLFLSEVSATTKKGEVHPNNTRFKSAMFKENILSVADTYKSLSKTSIRSVNITDQVILPSQWQRYITTSYPRQPRESFNKPHNIHVINKDRSSNKNRGERNVSMITHYGSKPTMLTGTKNAEIENFPKTASKRVKHGDNKVLGATYGGNNSFNTAPSSAGSDTWFEHPENVNKTIQRILAIRRFNKTSEHLNKPQNENELNYNVKLNTKLKGTGIISKKMFHHENPAATLYTSIRTFSKYVPKYAYDQSEKYFWGTSPKQGDYFLMLLNVPQNISRIFIDSGHVERQSDILQNARLSTRTSGDQVKSCQTLQWVANFVNGDVDTEALDITLPLNIDCIVIEVTADHYNWVIIREIAVFSLEEKDIISTGRKARHLPAQRNNIMEMQVSKETSKLSSPLKSQDITGKKITMEKESTRYHNYFFKQAKQEKSKHPERRIEGRIRH